MTDGIVIATQIKTKHLPIQLSIYRTRVNNRQVQ